jgi:hypothetical protein
MNNGLERNGKRLLPNLGHDHDIWVKVTAENQEKYVRTDL